MTVKAQDAGAGGDDETRRDFLLLTTSIVGTAGVALSAWPFIDSMNPAADVLALSTTEVDLSPVEVGGGSYTHPPPPAGDPVAVYGGGWYIENTHCMMHC